MKARARHFVFRQVYDMAAIVEASLAELWEKMTDESFHLLFTNRCFLLSFDRNLADYLNANRSLVPAECRAADGR